jgi:hypothetical protein
MVQHIDVEDNFMPQTKRKSLRKGVTKLGTVKARKLAAMKRAATTPGEKNLNMVKFGKAKLRIKGARLNPIRSHLASEGIVRIVRMPLQEAVISRTELANKALQLSDTQRASLEAARARAEARLRRPDMSADALRARERAGAEWEARHGPVTAFAGVMRRPR